MNLILGSQQPVFNRRMFSSRRMPPRPRMSRGLQNEIMFLDRLPTSIKKKRRPSTKKKPKKKTTTKKKPKKKPKKKKK